MDRRNNSLVVVKSTLSRLPLYYSYISGLESEGIDYVSSSVIAESLNLNPVLVRKDLASVSTVAGKPRLGFAVQTLSQDIGAHLGFGTSVEVVLVGAGSLGRLLLAHKGFSKLGLNLVAGFDRDENICGTQINGKPILSMEKLPSLVKSLNVKIGIIAVPESQAQAVCNMLVESGIQAIWNFAFTLLNVPSGVLVKNENLATSLAVLSHQLAAKQGLKEQQVSQN